MAIELSRLDGRIPQWDFSDLVERNCPICSDDGIPQYVRPDKLTVCECSTCGTWYVSPAPSALQLNDFYLGYSTQHQRLPDLSNRFVAKMILDASPEENLIMQEVLSLMDVKGKRCLDVGFGRGMYLHWFNVLGGIASGIDLDPTSVDFAKQYLGISDVREGTINCFTNHEKFDLVCMFNFVEHPLDVDNVIDKAAQLLDEEGYLVVLTPNASHARLSEDPIIFRVDLEHMQYFSYQSCSFIANKLGLRLVHLEGYGYPSLKNIERPVQRQGNLNGILKAGIKRIVRSLPGVSLARAIRMSLKGDPYRKNRYGTYHLLAIFQKMPDLSDKQD